MTTPVLSSSELKLIDDAAQYLEHSTLLIELAELVGKPADVLVRALNRIAPDRIDRIVSASLRAALALAVSTIPDGSPAVNPAVEQDINRLGISTSWRHKLSVAATGSFGGLFGLVGLAAELPITTTVMFRSIAAIAKEFGEDLRDPNTRLQCLSVFSFGSGERQGSVECAYLTARLGLQTSLTQATKVLSLVTADELTGMVQKGTAPAIVNLITHIAAQFNITVTQKTLVQALPLLGSATGAMINVALVGHYNRVARFHFGIRRLERKYDLEPIQAIYRDAARKIRQKDSARRLTLLPMPELSSKED